MADPKHGPLERESRRFVNELGDLADVQRPLAELAYRLARTLDEGAGLATAAVGREYRATLLVLREVGDGRGADAELLARLSAPMEHGPELRAVEHGRAGGGGGAAAGDAADAVASPRRRRRPGG